MVVGEGEGHRMAQADQIPRVIRERHTQCQSPGKSMHGACGVEKEERIVSSRNIGGLSGGTPARLPPVQKSKQRSIVGTAENITAETWWKGPDYLSTERLLPHDPDEVPPKPELGYSGRCPVSLALDRPWGRAPREMALQGKVDGGEVYPRSRARQAPRANRRERERGCEG